MTVPSLRKLLFVAPLFAAVGIAAACGPSGRPGPPPAPGISMPSQSSNCSPFPQTTVPAMPPRGTCETPPLPSPLCSVPGTSLFVFDGKLQVQTADGARMACDKLTILVGGAEPAE